MLMTFLRHGTRFHGKTVVMIILCLDIQVHWWTSGWHRSLSVDAKVKCTSLSHGSGYVFFNVYIVFPEILVKKVHLYIQLYVAKFPCGTHTRAIGKGY
jgi:hypothetical protein